MWLFVKSTPIRSKAGSLRGQEDHGNRRRSFPPGTHTCMCAHTHAQSQQHRQAYVFLHLIQGNVKMTPVNPRQRIERKKRGRQYSGTHDHSTGGPEHRHDETWWDALGIPVSNSGKWFVILETSGMIQNINEGHQGQQYLLRFDYNRTHGDTHTHRGITQAQLWPLHTLRAVTRARFYLSRRMPTNNVNYKLLSGCF